MDITTIPKEELEKDLKDSIADIVICSKALAIGIKEHKGTSVQERLKDNKYFVEVISKELDRRNTVIQEAPLLDEIIEYVTSRKKENFLERFIKWWERHN